MTRSFRSYTVPYVVPAYFRLTFRFRPGCAAASIPPVRTMTAVANRMAQRGAHARRAYASRIQHDHRSLSLSPVPFSLSVCLCLSVCLSLSLWFSTARIASPCRRDINARRPSHSNRRHARDGYFGRAPSTHSRVTCQYEDGRVAPRSGRHTKVQARHSHVLG